MIIKTPLSYETNNRGYSTNSETDTSGTIVKQTTFDVIYSPTIVQPPKLAYLYTPSNQEEIEYNNENRFKSIRRLFEGSNLKLFDFEKEKIKELKDFVKAQGSNFDYCDSYLHRFLQSCEYDINKTYAWLKSNHEFRKVQMPMNNPNILFNKKTIEILNLGFIYFSGRDNRFRPNIVIKLSILRKKFKKFTFEQWCDAITFLIEYCISYMLIPGKVENWNVILDLKDISLYNLPVDIKNLCIIFQKNYKCRLYRLYFMNISTIGSILYRLIPTFLGSHIEKKVVFIKEHEELFTYINKSQIEMQYGGNCNNLDSFFPPNEVSSEYFLEGDNPEYLLSTEDIVLKKTKCKTPRIADQSKSTISLKTEKGLIYHNPVFKEKEFEIKNRGLIVDSDRKRTGNFCCASSESKDNKCVIF
jgi:hypothetical protein